MEYSGNRDLNPLQFATVLRRYRSRCAAERAGFEPCGRRWQNLQAVRGLASQRLETRKEFR